MLVAGKCVARAGGQADEIGRRRPIDCERLGAGIDGHLVLAIGRHHRRQHIERRREGKRLAVLLAHARIVGIHEYVGADLQLGERPGHVEGMGAGAAAGDDRARNPIGGERRGERAHRSGRRPHRRTPLHRIEDVLDVAGIALQAAERKARIGRRGTRQGMAVLQRRDAGAALPDIDVDQHAERRIARDDRGLEAVELVAMVDDDGEWRDAVERGNPRRAVAPDDGRCHQQAGDALARHRLRLEERRAADADGAGRELPARDRRGFVRLGMGSQRHLVGRGGLRHALDVGMQRHRVDDQRRCIDPVERWKIGAQVGHGAQAA